MSKNEFVDFKTIKASVSIVQILEHYNLLESLHRSGDSYSGPCPLHNGQNKTAFRVSISKNCWNCFSECACGGNILDFVSKKENVTIRQAAVLIKGWFDLRMDKPSNEERQPSPAPAPPTKPEVAKSADQPEESTGPNVPLTFSLEHLEPDHPYLITERRLSAESIKTFGLGFCKKGILAGRIAIPIHNPDGKLVAYAGRWPGEPPEDKEKYKLPKGFKKTLEVFNLHRVPSDQGQPLIVVEGFFGCINLTQSGFLRTVALMGSSLSEAQEALILKATGLQDHIVLFFDEDEAGRNGREQTLIRLASKRYIKVLSPGEEGLQPDKLSGDQLRQLMAQV